MATSRHWSRLFAVAMLLCCASARTSVAEPAARPVLRIEAGMHDAALTDAATDRDGRYVATVGDDDTARIWNLASGRLLGVLRPPVGEGRLDAVAMTPDAATVAVAGWSKEGSIYLFDRATGRLEKRLASLPAAVRRLAFSADGRWLAATLGGSNGMRVWDWRSGSAALADGEVDGDGMSWSSDDRLAVSGLDGQIRLYRIGSAGLTRIRQAPAAGGRQPAGIAFAPDGRELALGYSDSARVDIVNADDLTPARSATDDGAADGNSANVAWSASGRMLYAGGTASREGRALVRRWPQAGRGAPLQTSTVGIAVTRLIALPDAAGSPDGVLAAGAQPGWGVLDAAGLWRQKQASPAADFGGVRTSFRLSADGRSVQFGFDASERSLHRFDLATRTLKPAQPDRLAAPRTEGLSIEGWADTATPTLAGRPLGLQEHDVSRSLAIAPNNATFALGTDRWLRHFDARGRELWRRPAPRAVRRVGIAATGRLLVAAYADGTIRWHRLSDGQELLAFFPHADRKRWVLWTPSGYYDASPGGEDLIGWQFDRGEDAAADFFPASGFRAHLRRPDVVDRVLDTLDEARAIAVAEGMRGTRLVTTDVARIRPPVIELASPPEVSASQARLTLRYRIRSAADAPPTRLRARVDGLSQPQARSFETSANAGVREVDVSVPPRDSRVELFAENHHGVSTPATVRVTWTGAAQPSAAEPVAGADGAPRLYVLAVGVSGYRHKDIDKLRFAAKDAADFAAAMQRQQGRLYAKVDVKLVTEADATRDNIADALDWLQRQVSPRDVGMLFLAGHGHGDPRAGFAFLPVDADPDGLTRTAVTMADIKSALDSMQGRAMAFLDTSRSGNVFAAPRKASPGDMSGVIDELASAANGVTVFSSSSGRQSSLEDAAWSNGAFTKALVEGIDGKAAMQAGGKVTFRTLDAYVAGRVAELTQGRQSPAARAPGGIDDLAIAATAR